MTTMKRRDFLKSATTVAALAAADDAPALSAARFIRTGKSYDVAVIGAGVIDFMFNGQMGQADLKRQMKLFADEVMPKIRDI